MGRHQSTNVTTLSFHMSPVQSRYLYRTDSLQKSYRSYDSAPVCPSEAERQDPKHDSSIQSSPFSTLAVSKLCLTIFRLLSGGISRTMSLKSQATGLSLFSVLKHEVNLDPFWAWHHFFQEEK